MVGRIDPDPVIANGDSPLPFSLFSSYLDFGWCGTPILQGITGEIVQELSELGGVAHEGRKTLAGHAGLIFADRGFQSEKGRFEG